jgi:hypothetical protein
MSDEEVGTEEVKDAVEAGEPVVAPETVAEPVAAEPAAVEIPPAPPVVPVAQPVTALPPRRQTGLIVVVGSIVLILVLALVFWQPMFDTVKKMTSGTPSATTETISPAKAKLTATIGFVEAYMDQDVLKMKPYLTDEAQAAAPDADWKSTAASIPTGTISFTTPVWSGDTTASLSFSAPDPASGTDTTGTLAFGYAEAKPLVVTMLFDSGGSADTITFTLVQSGTSWRVVSEASSGGNGDYDATFVQSIITSATPSETTPTP